METEKTFSLGNENKGIYGIYFSACQGPKAFKNNGLGTKEEIKLEDFLTGILGLLGYNQEIDTFTVETVPGNNEVVSLKFQGNFGSLQINNLNEMVYERKA